MKKVGAKPKNPVGRPRLERGKGGYRKLAGRKRKKNKKIPILLYYKSFIVLKNFAPGIEKQQQATEKEVKIAVQKMKEYFYGIIPPE